MTGTGKTTFIEFLLNLLSNNASCSDFNRFIEVENENPNGCESSTKVPVEYRISFLWKGIWKSITLVDTPGLSDTGGVEKDAENLVSILQALKTLEYLDKLIYVLPSTNTRRTLDLLHALCKTFSIMPKEVVEFSMFVVTFTNEPEVAEAALRVVEGIMPSLADSPYCCLENPWAEYKLKMIKNSMATAQDGASSSRKRRVYASSSGGGIQQETMEKSKMILDIILNEAILPEKRYVMTGIDHLYRIRERLVTLLPQIAETVSDLIKRVGIASLDMEEIKKFDNFDQFLEDYSRKTECILQQRQVMAKKHKRTPDYNTVCENPSCRSPVCHENCSLKKTFDRGSQIFAECACADEDKVTCSVCNCGLVWHVHQFYIIELQPDTEVQARLKEIFEQASKKLVELGKTKGSLPRHRDPSGGWAQENDSADGSAQENGPLKPFHTHSRGACIGYEGRHRGHKTLCPK